MHLKGRSKLKWNQSGLVGKGGPRSVMRGLRGSRSQSISKTMCCAGEISPSHASLKTLVGRNLVSEWH